MGICKKCYFLTASDLSDVTTEIWWVWVNIPFISHQLFSGFKTFCTVTSVSISSHLSLTQHQTLSQLCPWVTLVSGTFCSSANLTHQGSLRSHEPTLLHNPMTSGMPQHTQKKKHAQHISNLGSAQRNCPITSTALDYFLLLNVNKSQFSTSQFTSASFQFTMQNFKKYICQL